ncbi:hypothetical protein DSO57_1032203 [Entomophthora muscae]|uniref:Uncharacterized protein n=1 Tax=Entomophthora muscae TaxID=34485 RepID=A0ACC2SD20_9FUNG|nr:hypothetical protein DSO57_1032203 [Entomophthora muscae]
MDMEPPVIPKPMPASAAELPLDHTNKLFGIVYITLTGVIDTIVPAAGLWLWVGKSMSYLIKLAPILWWALPTQSETRQFPNTSKPANQGWFPDTGNIIHSSIQGTPTSSMGHNLIGQPQYCDINKPQLAEVLGRRHIEKERVRGISFMGGQEGDPGGEGERTPSQRCNVA